MTIRWKAVEQYFTAGGVCFSLVGMEHLSILDLAMSGVEELIATF